MTKPISQAKVKATLVELQQAIDDARGDTSATQNWRQRRSEETRCAIMNAAVECLVDRGYANTTTQHVADRVGLSRGAMVHHYATRAELIAAVIDHIFIQMMEMAYRGVEEMAKVGEVDRSGSLDLHWRVINSPAYQAYIELKIAARTDAELRGGFDPKAAAFDQLWRRKIDELFPDWIDTDGRGALAWSFARMTLEGLKINERIVQSKAERAEIRDTLLKVLDRIHSGDI